jgi:hypothetical protein
MVVPSIMTSQWSEWIDVGPRFASSQPEYVHKFQRSVSHLNAIAQEVGDWIAAGIQTPAERELEIEGDWVILRPGPPRPLPGAWPLYLGDFLTNARATLDYLVYDLVKANRHDPGTHTSFPICETEGKWQDDIIQRAANRGRAPIWGVSDEIIVLIHDEQPLRHPTAKARTNDPLMHLLRMCNADKHRTLHVAAIHTGKVLKVWAEPEGLVDITGFKAAAAVRSSSLGESEVARVKVRPAPGADPDADVYFGYQRAAQIAFSPPGGAGQVMLEDLFGIINSIIRIGRTLEQHTNSDLAWFSDLYAGRVGGGNRASS